MNMDLQRQTNCFICGLANQTVKPPNTRTYEVVCAKCGEYSLTMEAEQLLKSIPDNDRPKISEWIYEQNALGINPTIKTGNLTLIINRPRLTHKERLRRLLIYLAKKTPHLGEQVRFDDVHVQALLQTYNQPEISIIIQSFRAGGFIANNSLPGCAELTLKGAMQAEEWEDVSAASSQGFVAMWFAPELNEAWLKGFEPAIRNAGYKAQRIDQKEHANKVCDEIISEIRRSRFVVADFTGHRGGVYFEAGYAMGRSLPVIWTCRKDCMDDLHFDIRQYNCIDWQNADELAIRLQKRIEAVIGDGPGKSEARDG